MERPMVEKVLRINETGVRFAAEGSLLMNLKWKIVLLTKGGVMTHASRPEGPTIL